MYIPAFFFSSDLMFNSSVDTLISSMSPCNALVFFKIIGMKKSVWYTRLYFPGYIFQNILESFCFRKLNNGFRRTFKIVHRILIRRFCQR